MAAEQRLESRIVDADRRRTRRSTTACVNTNGLALIDRGQRRIGKRRRRERDAAISENDARSRAYQSDR